MQNRFDPNETMAMMASMVEQIERDLALPQAVPSTQRPKVERQLLSVKKTIARLDPKGAGAPYLSLLSAKIQKKLLAK